MFPVDALPISPASIRPTPEERRSAPALDHTRDTPPPPGPGVRQCAEWEPVTGVLVRYPFGLPYLILREMAEDIDLWVIVATSALQAQCAESLRVHGIDMNHVRFALRANNSYWTRDYGPQFEFDAQGDQGIVDFHYYSTRPLDDLVNYGLGAVWSLPVYGCPLSLQGGNLMCDGHNNGFSTDLVDTENPGFDPPTIAGYMQDYLGLRDYHVIPDVDSQPYGVHHIDCWAKLLDDQTIMVAQFDPGYSWYARTEENVAAMRTWRNAWGRPYKIVRVYCGGHPPNEPAIPYTNSIILNNKVLVPVDHWHQQENGAALQAYRDAMPGYEVIGCRPSDIDSLDFWSSVDAIHCRSMGIHDRYMLRVDFEPAPDTVWTTQGERLDVLIDDRSEAGLKTDSLLVYWKLDGESQFQPIRLAATAGADSFCATIPSPPGGGRVDYYVFAADLSNRRATRPPCAPAGCFSYFVPEPASAEPWQAGSSLALSSRPNPFASTTTISYRQAEGGPVRLDVLDLRGTRVATLVAASQSAGPHTVLWDGRGDGPDRLPCGIYWFRLTVANRTEVRRTLLLR